MLITGGVKNHMKCEQQQFLYIIQDLRSALVSLCLLSWEVVGYWILDVDDSIFPNSS